MKDSKMEEMREHAHMGKSGQKGMGKMRREPIKRTVSRVTERKSKGRK